MTIEELLKARDKLQRMQPSSSIQKITGTAAKTLEALAEAVPSTDGPVLKMKEAAKKAPTPQLEPSALLMAM